MSALFLTRLNGWVTERRCPSTQQLSSSCPFCCEWLSESSIEHFSICKILKHASRNFLGLCEIANRTQFLCLEDEPEVTIVKRVLHLYLVKRTFDFCRHISFDKWYFTYRNFLVKFVAELPRGNFLVNKLYIDDELFFELALLDHAV